jgi:hypothetical protein
MTTSVGINGDFLMRGNAQRVEVSVARRIFRLHGFTDHTPHVASRVKNKAASRQVALSRAEV